MGKSAGLNTTRVPMLFHPRWTLLLLMMLRSPRQGPNAVVNPLAAALEVGMNTAPVPATLLTWHLLPSPPLLHLRLQLHQILHLRLLPQVHPHLCLQLLLHLHLYMHLHLPLHLHL